jgi:hypothetical protein
MCIVQSFWLFNINSLTTVNYFYLLVKIHSLYHYFLPGHLVKAKCAQKCTTFKRRHWIIISSRGQILWWQDATLFVYFSYFIRMHRFTRSQFIQYIYPSPFAEASYRSCLFNSSTIPLPASYLISCIEEYVDFIQIHLEIFPYFKGKSHEMWRVRLFF